MRTRAFCISAVLLGVAFIAAFNYGGSGPNAPDSKHLARKVHYTAGPDQVCFTADDEIYDYHAYTYNDQGQQIQDAYYLPGDKKGAGPDGVRFTADDLMNNCNLSTYDDQGRRTRTVLYYLGTGEKRVIDDKAISGYHTFIYDAQGRETRRINYMAPGDDRLWCTPDDMVGGYTSSAYNKQGQLAEKVFYSNAGPDKKWFTADDVTNIYDAYTYNAKGRQVREDRHITGAVKDRLNYDKGIYTYNIFKYDGLGKLIQEDMYTTSGADGKWFTTDDPVNRYTTYIYE